MIDWSQIDELRAEVDDAFDEVVSLFLEEADDIMARVRQAQGVPRRDPAALAADLHALKGAALNLGLRAFADACGEGERRAQSGDADSIDLDGIIACFAASRIALLKGLDRDAA